MKNILLLSMIHLLSINAMADVKLPKIFGDNMILQRNKPITVWGWADAGEKVTIQFKDQLQKTKAGKDGKWKITLNAEPAGGPFQLSTTGKNKIILKNILIGEVWICSGQSNMEMTVASSKNAAQEMSEGNFPEIRQFEVPAVIAAAPAEDLPGGEWESANPATVGKFTAVGYFFAKRLYEELKIPVGLINTSWGGTIIETLISREALEGSDDFQNVFSKKSFNDIEAQNEKEYQALKKEIETPQGTLTPGLSAENFKSLSYDHSLWKKMTLPGSFNENGLAKFDGTVWFRKLIKLDKDDIAKPAVLNLSTIDDMDETYINGQLAGTTKTYDVAREYNIPTGVLKEGDNIVAVRVTDGGGNGGFFGKPYELKLVCSNKTIPLAGEWFYKIENLKKNAANPNSYASLLFNSMINPLVPFAIRGALWYQGESNAARAVQYQKAFPLMIADWRRRFQQGDFPFYFVQLASFNAGNGNSNKGSNWAELRESQTKTLSLPNTGMAVTLDIGESNDIHPKNKQGVGERLAAIALHNLYNKNIAYTGPMYQSMETDGNKIIISFSNVDSGYFIKEKYNYIKGFEIAGADKRFYFAQAYINDGKVIVYSDSVKIPVAARYGWADDMPEANLYNRQGFPAVPFRTDDWIRITEKNQFKIE
ncbi:MAG: sialate O-acetylesterase [Ginsengibacter sp.]